MLCVELDISVNSWWTRYQTAERGVQDLIVEFARSKLLAHRRLDNGKPSPPESLEEKIAVLSTRLLLDIGTRESARNTENKLVGSHMRIAYSVPKHREYMYSGSPSEPVLAEAAAQAMSSMRDVVDSMADFVRSGLIQKGERGELVARLLLTLAHDHGCEALIRASKKEQSLRAPKYSQPISVEAFLKELLSPAFIDDILNSTPENDSLSGTSLREAFKGATIRFSHFAKAGDASGTTSAASAAAYIRGMAFQLTNYQPFIDIMIPIHFTDTPTGINNLVPDNMSAIFISVKNRVQAMYHSVDEKQLKFFPAGGDPKSRPYIVIVMNLGMG